MTGVHISDPLSTGTTCPFCGYQADCASMVSDDPKEEPKLINSISMCMKCGEWGVFVTPTELRKPYHGEYEEIVKMPMAVKLRQAWVSLRAEGKLGAVGVIPIGNLGVTRR